MCNDRADVNLSASSTFALELRLHPVPNWYQWEGRTNVSRKLFLLCLLFAVNTAFADTLTINVSATADIHKITGNDPYVGTSTGNLAPSLVFAAVDGRTFTFNVTGTTNCGPCSSWGPDGNPAGGGFQMPFYAVFLSDTFPSSGLSDLGNPNDFTSLHPELGQVFFLGDGWTGVGAGVGTQQLIYAPDGATHLYFGFIDSPGFYGDNSGSLSVVADTQIPSGTTVPEPGSVALLGTGLMTGAGFLRGKLLAR